MTEPCRLGGIRGAGAAAEASVASSALGLAHLRSSVDAASRASKPRGNDPARNGLVVTAECRAIWCCYGLVALAGRASSALSLPRFATTRCRRGETGKRRGPANLWVQTLAGSTPAAGTATLLSINAVDGKLLMRDLCVADG